MPSTTQPKVISFINNFKEERKIKSQTNHYDSTTRRNNDSKRHSVDLSNYSKAEYLPLYNEF